MLLESLLIPGGDSMSRTPILFCDDGSEIELPFKWEICSRCDGHNRNCEHVECDGGGFTSSEWEDYLAGRYDRPCPYCEGGKVKVADRSRMTKAQWREFVAQERDDADYDFDYTTHRYGVRIARYVEVTRDDFDAVREAYQHEMRKGSIYSFDDLKKRAAAEIAHQIRATEGALIEQTARFDNWKQLVRWNGHAWEPVPQTANAEAAS
jgi:hypothetical protein